MKLLVVGADGKLGQEVVARGLSRGHEITAFSRHPERIAVSDPKLHLCAGDVLVAADVERALAGQGAVAFCIGTHRRTGEICLYSDGVKMVLTEMARIGVRRIVAVSAAGVGDAESPATPPFFRHVVVPMFARSEYDDMRRMEAELEASDAAWTVIKPLWLRDRSPSARVHVTTDPRTPRHWGIARADVANVILDALDHNRWIYKQIWLSR